MVKLYRLALSRCSWRMFFKLLNPKTRDQDESCLTSTQWYKTLWLKMMFLDCFLHFMNNFWICFFQEHLFCKTSTYSCFYFIHKKFGWYNLANLVHTIKILLMKCRYPIGLSLMIENSIFFLEYLKSNFMKWYFLFFDLLNWFSDTDES